MFIGVDSGFDMMIIDLQVYSRCEDRKNYVGEFSRGQKVTESIDIISHMTKLVHSCILQNIIYRTPPQLPIIESLDHNQSQAILFRTPRCVTLVNHTPCAITTKCKGRPVACLHGLFWRPSTLKRLSLPSGKMAFDSPLGHCQ